MCLLLSFCQVSVNTKVAASLAPVLLQVGMAVCHTGRMGVYMEKRVAFCVLKALVAAYIVTGLLLLILAFALYKLGLSENVVELGVVFIYLLSSAIGGFFIGKCMEVKRLLWGVLLGLFYAVLLLVLSLIVRGNAQGIIQSGLLNTLICLGGGAIGAFLS